MFFLLLDYTKSGTIVLVRHEITCNSLAAKRRVREMFTLVARAAWAIVIASLRAC